MIAESLKRKAPPGVLLARRAEEKAPALPVDTRIQAQTDDDGPSSNKALQILMGAGMLAGGLGITGNAVAAAPAQQVQEQAIATSEEHLQMLTHFKSEGALTRRTLGFPSDLTPAEAAQRLDQNESVFVKLKSGQTLKLGSNRDLETLDTLHGLGLHPNLHPDLVASLKHLAESQGQKDGVFKPGGQEVTAFETWRILSDPRDGAGSASGLAGLAGLAVGLGIAGAGIALIQNGKIPQLKGKNEQLMWLAGAGLVGLAAVTGAGIGYANYVSAFPEVLEARQGMDANLSLRQISDVVDISSWLKTQADHPFTPDQQIQVLQNLDVHDTGFRHKKLTAEQALSKLAAGKAIALPDPLKPGSYIEIPTLRHLQEYDTVFGLGLNPVTTQAEMQSLRFLKDTFQLKGERINGYQALDSMLRDRKPLQSKHGGKTYTLANLREVQELNALKGDGANTILPSLEFEAMRHFDTLFREGDKTVDSFEALQKMRQRKPVQVLSEGRGARVSSPEDAHELYSLEVTKTNTILPEGRSYELLQYWQGQGGYSGGRAYEALQTMQRGGEFEVISAGRLAPARSYQDLQDLAAFEGRDNPFPDTVPKSVRDRLEYFQSQSPLNFKVGQREGRAYEAYRELRDGKSFDAKAGGVWNRVESAQDLHELDAMLGRRVNDIGLPTAQYDLLHHLGDDSRPEGLNINGERVNSYQALQGFQKGQPVGYDFVGGDFADRLNVPIQDLEHLQEARERRDNQKEYDKYRYTVPEFQEKLKLQESQLPQLAQRDLEQGQSHLSDGQSHLRRGQSDLSDAESDLRSGKSDKSWAESRLWSAYAMPTTVPVTKYRTVTNADGTTSSESYTDYEHNSARDWAISSAQSDVWSAESKIRRAESDISDAEREIREAESEIAQAQREIRETEEILRIMQAYGPQVTGLTESNFQERIAQLKTQVDRMHSLSHTSALRANLAREQKLIANQTTRPERPAGWKVPSPLAQR